jgi:N-acetylglucosaminyldiphosphoundecaprenol N-acetyl-beta-D-mannosaminyltransferase
VKFGDQVNVLGVGVHATDPQSVAQTLNECIQGGRKGYVCLTGVHGVMEARREPDLKSIFADSLLVAPDGVPTVWMGHLQGFSKMRRVYGPDLMIDIFGRAEFSDCVHFFCGGEPGVAENLRDMMLHRFPQAKITGTFSPPFRPMTPTEEKELAAKVSLLKPDIIWVGLSTPKQERFMARYLPMLDTKLMIGVGAAFLFHTGAIRDSPEWIKRAGLQWLDRLFQEPSRLWRRYLRNNPVFVFQVILQIIGLKHHKLENISKSRKPLLTICHDNPERQGLNVSK